MSQPYLRIGYLGKIVKDDKIPPDTYTYLDWNTKQVYRFNVVDYIPVISPSSFVFIDTVNLKGYKVNSIIKPINEKIVFQDLLSLEIYNWDGIELTLREPIIPGAIGATEIINGSEINLNTSSYVVRGVATISGKVTFPANSTVAFHGRHINTPPLLIFEWGSGMSVASSGIITFQGNPLYPRRSGGIYFKDPENTSEDPKLNIDGIIFMDLMSNDIASDRLKQDLGLSYTPALTVYTDTSLLNKINFYQLKINLSRTSALFLKNIEMTSQNLFIEERSERASQAIVTLNNSSISIVDPVETSSPLWLLSDNSPFFDIQTSNCSVTAGKPEQTKIAVYLVNAFYSIAPNVTVNLVANSSAQSISTFYTSTQYQGRGINFGGIIGVTGDFTLSS